MKRFGSLLTLVRLLVSACVLAVPASISGLRAEDGTDFSARLSRLDALRQQALVKVNDCRQNDACGERSCSGEANVLADLTNIRAILNQYDEVLDAEEAVLDRANTEAIANNDRLAAKMEAARIAASATRTTDEMLGTVVEINGVIANLKTFLSQPVKETLKDPVAVWETVKDLNSLINRFDHSYNDLEHQVESIRYQPGISDALAEDKFNLKSLLEDNLIDLLPLSTGGSRKFTKDNTSNIVDAQSAVQELVGLRKKLNELDAAARQWQSSGGDSLSGAKAKARYDAARQIALAATQIAARYVKAKVSEPALRDFRGILRQARQQFKAQTHRYLKQVEEQEAVRDQMKQLEKLNAGLTAAIDALEPCAFERCKAARAADHLVSLLPLEPDPRNGRLKYRPAQERLKGQLDGVLEKLEGHLNRKPAEFQETLSISSPDLIFKPKCKECEALAIEVKARGDRIAYFGQRLLSLGDTGDGKLLQMKDKRNALLKDAEEQNAIYKERTEGRVGRMFKKLHADQQAELLEISTNIRRLTSAARDLGRKIKRFEAIRQERALLVKKQNEQMAAQKTVLDRLYACNDNMCQRQANAGDATSASPTSIPASGAGGSLSGRAKDDCAEDEAAPVVSTEVTTTTMTTATTTTTVTVTPQEAVSMSGDLELTPSPSDNAAAPQGDDTEYVFVEVEEPVTIPYWCTKPETGNKLVRCYLKIDTITEQCWVPKAVAQKGVTSCTEARKTYKSRNGG